MDIKNICIFNQNQSSDLICSKFIYETTDCQKEPAFSSEHTLHIAAKGNGNFVLGKESHSISVGTLFFVPKNECFAVSGDKDFEYSYISFSGRRANELLERVGIGRNNCVFEGLEGLLPFWLECVNDANKDNIDMLGESVLLYSLARLKPVQKETNDIISQITSLTSERFSDPTLSLSVISEKLGYHEKYISAHFKKETGVTYTQYLRELRIRHSLFLIEQGVVSVKNIAILSGFRDPLYFSKVFKEEKGISPKEYISNKKRFSSDT